jgi:hypothetical protein
VARRQREPDDGEQPRRRVLQRHNPAAGLCGGTEDGQPQAARTSEQTVRELHNLAQSLLLPGQCDTLTFTPHLTSAQTTKPTAESRKTPRLCTARSASSAHPPIAVRPSGHDRRRFLLSEVLVGLGKAGMASAR